MIINVIVVIIVSWAFLKVEAKKLVPNIIHHVFIPFLSQFCHNLMNLESLWINFLMNIQMKLELPLPHHIVIKM